MTDCIESPHFVGDYCLDLSRIHPGNPDEWYAYPEFIRHAAYLEAMVQLRFPVDELDEVYDKGLEKWPNPCSPSHI